jgi:imidazolonepropionase-like amidohydrolase
MASNKVLFTNVRVLDGSGELPFLGEVLVEDNRIRHVGRGLRTTAAAGGGQMVIDGRGATLMPGLCDAHAHFSWNDQWSLEAIQRMPPEEHTLHAMDVAKTYIEMGYTMAVGAAAAKPRLDVVIRNAINNGQIQGPRYLANGQEIATLGGLGDTMPPHIEHEGLAFGAIVSGPEQMRAQVRRFIKYGVDLIKLNMSGEEIAGVPATHTPITDEEVIAAVDESKRRGIRACAHARSAESVKMCVRYGVPIVYHASYADEEGLDLLEQNKGKHWVAPGLAWLIKTSQDAGDWGIKPGGKLASAYKYELDVALRALQRMHRRGIKILPGGDYGFAWTPQGTNSKDLQYLVELVGMSPMEAIVAATRYGGEIMGKPDELGQIKSGYYADLLLVDGDPVANIRVLQDKDRILAVMKDGRFYREPDLRPHRLRYAS